MGWSRMELKIFDLFGYESINEKKHDHNDKDSCHRCDSNNTKVHCDSVDECYWIFLKCNDCGLCCIFDGGC